MKNQYRKIWIKWLDSSSWESVWYHLDDALKKANEETMVCENVGYLIYEDNEKIVLSEALSWHKEKVNSVHGIFLIPAFAVVDWEWL